MLGSNGGVFQTSAALALNGPIGGPGGLTVVGPQLLLLNGAGQYTGPMNVMAGSLPVNGSTGTGLTTVAKSATLGGTGTVGGSLINNGTLRVAGNFTQSPSGLLQVNLGAGSPVLQVGGAVQAGGAGSECCRQNRQQQDRPHHGGRPDQRQLQFGST